MSLSMSPLGSDPTPACPVCLSTEMDDPVATKCNHIYCQSCLEHTIVSTGACAVCRKDLSDISSEVREQVRLESERITANEALAQVLLEDYTAIIDRLNGDNSAERDLVQGLNAAMNGTPLDLRLELVQAMMQYAAHRFNVGDPGRADRMAEQLMFPEQGQVPPIAHAAILPVANPGVPPVAARGYSRACKALSAATLVTLAAIAIGFLASY